MNTVFETNFTVFPPDANPLYPLIFGGAFMGHMDVCAYQAVNRFLYDSDNAETAVTHKAEYTFSKPCYVGDLIFLRAEITGTRHKSITVKVTAEREKPGFSGRDQVAEANFVFVSIKNQHVVSDRPDLLPYVHHGMELPK